MFLSLDTKNIINYAEEEEMNFLSELENVFKTDKRFLGEKNQIIKTKVLDAARSNDKLLIKSLLENDLMRESFFVKVDDIYVFDKTKFVWVLESKEFLPDSYTLYKNKIGLVDSQDNLISQMQDVTLVWPYKDCILEGGQTKDDQKRDEVFYNETLAPEQVNRLLAPKVFGNAKRYTVEGVEENIEFKESDNLIIKGNNLKALSSLLARYEGKIKLIYIDPPYLFNKKISEDSFKYNSSFHKSTWLTFIKNRLEIAWKLLSSDGSIWISMGDDGMHYLKVLADDVFGQEHFVATLPRKTRDGKSDVPFNLSQDFDWVLVYTKASELNYVLGRQIKRKYYETEDFPGRPWRVADITKQTTTKERPNSDFTMINPKTGKEYPVNPKRSWAVTRDTFDEYYQAGGIGFPDDYEFMSGKRPFRRVFKDEDERNQKPTAVYSDFLMRDFIENLMLRAKNKDGNDEIDTLFSRDDFDYAKPENLIRNIIQVTTNEGDLVLDFFMGSATTQAVALKMNRHFIGIEQMDYIKDVSVQRLKKVIDGEQGGISKYINWQGGGSFVYCELLEDNQRLMKEIQDAGSTGLIKDILIRASKNGKFVPAILLSDLEKTDEEFENLSFEEQKRITIEMLDKNKLYVNLSDIDDEDMAVNDADKAFTKSFYGLD